MFKKYNKDNENRNVFRSWDSIKSNKSECFFLNKYCLQQCYCEKDINLNITRYFIDRNIYDWEIEVYMKLLNKNVLSYTRSGAGPTGPLGRG